MKIKVVGIVIGIILLLPVMSISAVSEPEPELQLKIRGGFGFKVIVTNVGDEVAKDIELIDQCAIGRHLSLIILGPVGYMNSEKISLGDIEPGSSVQIRFLVYGLAIIEPTMTVQGENINPVEVSSICPVIGPFVLAGINN